MEANDLVKCFKVAFDCGNKLWELELGDSCIGRMLVFLRRMNFGMFWGREASTVA